MTPRSPSRRAASAVRAVALLACAVALVAAAGCKKPPSAKIAANTPAGWSSLAVPTKGVTFRAPPTWRATPREDGNGQSLAIDDAGTNLKLTVEPREKGTDIDEVPKRISAAAAKQFPSYKELSVEILEIAGSRSSRLTYEIAMGGVAMKATQYVLMTDQNVCFVTYTARAGSFEAHAKDVEQVAASVKMP